MQVTSSAKVRRSSPAQESRGVRSFFGSAFAAGILTRTGGFILATRQLGTYTEVRLKGEGRFVVS